MSDASRWITIPATQWKTADASVPIDIFGRLATDPELARDWRGSALLTFDDVEEESAYLSPAVRVFLGNMYTSVPHALYFLHPASQYSAVLSWLCAQEQVEDIALEEGGRFSFAVYSNIYKTAEEMFLAVAAFAISMGDDWVAATEDHVRTFLTCFGDMRVGDMALPTRLRTAIKERF